MKKVVLPSLLAAAGAAFFAPFALAQDASAGGGQAAGQGSGQQITLPPDEYNVYSAAEGQQGAAKVTALKAYLQKYPNSPVKASVLTDILGAATATGDKAQILDASNNLLAVDPQNLRALAFEVYYGKADADATTDPSAKQAALDKVAGYAKTGLTVDQGSTPPKGMSDADFAALKPKTLPVFSSALAADDLAKKDNADAITVLKAELAAVDPAQTQQVGAVLQDEYTLANAYYTSTPPDYLNCAWYASRVAGYAPAPQNASILTLANYCYAKYHGSKDGYDALAAQSKAALNPPDNLATTITPAPKPEDIVKNLIATTPDLATLALSDKEFVLQYGQQADADKVFDTIKGKSVTIPGATVIAATADQLQVAVSDDAKQSKQADFTIAMKAPLTTIPAVGSSVDVTGTYSSYTSPANAGASAASATAGSAASPATTGSTAAASTASSTATPASGSTPGSAATPSSTPGATTTSGSSSATGSSAASTSTPAAGSTASSASSAPTALMITMTDGALVEKKAPPAKKTTTPARRRSTH